MLGAFAGAITSDFRFRFGDCAVDREDGLFDPRRTASRGIAERFGVDGNHPPGNHVQPFRLTGLLQERASQASLPLSLFAKLVRKKNRRHAELCGMCQGPGGTASLVDKKGARQRKQNPRPVA